MSQRYQANKKSQKSKRRSKPQRSRVRLPGFADFHLEDRTVPTNINITNSTPILIPGSGTSGTALPYPSTVTVNVPVGEVLTSLHRVLVRKSDVNRFITLFCALIAPDGTFSFVNAGHNPPILVRANGQTELLSTGSMLLGAFDFAEFHTRETKLEPSDVVVVFSDGVTEAVNTANQLFGDQRLEELIKESASLSAKEIKDRIEQEVRAFTRDVPQRDDITMIALKMRSLGR